MDTTDILEYTLTSLAEFKDQFEDMAGANELLGDYSAELQQALDTETLTPADQRQILGKANEILGLIAAEWEKSKSVSGAHLQLAIVQKLRADIRVAIRRSHRSGLKDLFDVGDDNDLQRGRTSNLI